MREAHLPPRDHRVIHVLHRAVQDVQRQLVLLLGAAGEGGVDVAVRVRVHVGDGDAVGEDALQVGKRRVGRLVL